MKSHCHRLFGSLLLSPLVVAVLCTLPAHAMTLGHSRVVSMPNQPLQIAVQIKELSAGELQALTARVAPQAAWQGAGLVPPVALDSIGVVVQPAAQPGQARLLLQSAQSSANDVIDVLIDVSTLTSNQRYQVSVLQHVKPTPVSLATTKPGAAATSTATSPLLTSTLDAESSTTKARTHVISKGATAWAIARNHQSQAYTYQQFIMALLERNPHAFSQSNVNMLRAGATVVIPTLEQIQSINPQKAQQLYQQHLRWFDTYRQRLAQGEAIEAPLAAEKRPAQTSTEAASSSASKNEQYTQTRSEKAQEADRLQLTTQSPEQLKAAQSASIAQELAYTTERLGQLSGSSLTKQPESNAIASADTADTALKIGSAAVSSLDSSVSKAVANVQATKIINADSAHLTEPKSESAIQDWMQGHLIKVIGLVILIVLMIAWVLRRTFQSRLSDNKVLRPRTQERIANRQNGQIGDATADELEFREIK